MLERIDSPPLVSDGAASVAVSFDLDLVASAGRYDLELPQNLKRAVPKRQAEFLAGRYCAREALRERGVADAGVIGMRPDRSPQWPAGMLGAITHTDGIAWAAVACDDACRGIGIDSETIPADAVADEICPVVCTPHDNMVLAREVAPRWGEAAAVCLALSARESFYKCLAESDAMKPEPGDLFLSAIDVATGRFRLQLSRRLSAPFPAGRQVEGLFVIAPPFVHTAIEW